MHALLHRGRAMLTSALLTIGLGVAAPAAQAQFPGGPSFPVISINSGSWTSGSIWTGGGVPISSDMVTVSTGHTVVLTGDVTVADLTLNDDSVLDLNGHSLTVDGKLTMSGQAGHAPELKSSSGSSPVTVQCLETDHTKFSSVAISVVDAASCTQTTLFRTGSISWTASTFSQTGGNATIATNLSISPTFAGSSLRILGSPSISGTLTLSGSGGVAFLPSTAGTMLISGGLAISGSHAVTVDWTGVDSPTTGTAVTLVQAPTPADLTGLTSTNTANTIFTRPATGGNNTLVATYDAPPVNSGAAPSLSAVTDANSGYVFPGDVLTCDPGVWTGGDSFTYAWKNATTNAALPGTASTYTARDLDVGVVVTCTATAHHNAHSVAGTAPTGKTVAVAPTNSAAPAVTANNNGTTAAAPGDTLSCSQGTWANASSFTYAWLRNDTVIGGQSGATYAVVDGDLTASLTCKVTGSNAAGSLTVQSGAKLGKARPTISVTGLATTYAAGATGTFTLTVPGADSVTCLISGALEPCAPGSNTFSVGNGSGGGGLLSVTATNAAGSETQNVGSWEVEMPQTTVPPGTVAFVPGGGGNPVQNNPGVGSGEVAGPNEQRSKMPLKPTIVPVGRSVKRQLPANLRVRVGGDEVDVVEVKRTAAGTTEEQWSATDGATLVTMPIYAYAVADVDPPTGPMAGITPKSGPLACGAKEDGVEGTFYNWFAAPTKNRVISDERELTSKEIPDNSVISCASVKPGAAGNDFDRWQALMAGGKRFAIARKGKKILIWASADATGELTVSNPATDDDDEATASRLGKKNKKNKKAGESIKINKDDNEFEPAGLKKGSVVTLRVVIASKRRKSKNGKRPRKVATTLSPALTYPQP